jgi:hypothetical protein
MIIRALCFLLGFVVVAPQGQDEDCPGSCVCKYSYLGADPNNQQGPCIEVELESGGGFDGYSGCCGEVLPGEPPVQCQSFGCALPDSKYRFKLKQQPECACAGGVRIEINGPFWFSQTGLAAGVWSNWIEISPANSEFGCGEDRVPQVTDIWCPSTGVFFYSVAFYIRCDNCLAQSGS